MGTVVKLGEIATLYDSLHKTPKSYVEQGYPMIRVTDVKRGFVNFEGTKQVNQVVYEEFSKKYKPQIGDVIFTRVGSYGNSCYVDKKADFCLGQNTVCIAPNKVLIDPYYLYVFLNSSQAKRQIDSFISGSSQPTISLKSIKEIKLELPDIVIQRSLSSSIAAYDNLIENNNRRIAILEDMAQSLYREWFVHFRFPGHENCEFKDSELGRIPEGWEVKKLDDVINIYRGRSYRSKDLVGEEGYPFLNLKNVAREGGFRRDGLKKYTGPFKEHHIAKPNDIIMAVTDMTQERAIIARPARVPEMGYDNFIYSIDLIKITVKEDVDDSFVYSLLRYSDFPHIVKQFANGANVLHLKPQVVSDYEAIIPSKSVMRKFSKKIKSIHTHQDLLEKKNDILVKQRDMLLPKLISGSINV